MREVVNQHLTFRLQGKMVIFKDTDDALFLCSPRFVFYIYIYVTKFVTYSCNLLSVEYYMYIIYIQQQD